MIHPQHEGAPDSPETKILQLNNDVLDLRNQVLFDRVGEDAMLAAADAEASVSSEKNFFDDLERSMASSTGAVALGEVFKENDLNELSQQMFEGKGLHELSLHERQRVEHAQAELDAHKQAVNGTESSEGLTVVEEKDGLDAELNRVFDDRIYVYDARLQTPDTVNLYARRSGRATIDAQGNVASTAEMHVDLGDITAIPTAKITTVNGQVEATRSAKFVDKQTGHEVDFIKMAVDAGIPEEQVREEMQAYEAVSTDKLDSETIGAIQDGLLKVKTYLESQLGAKSDVPREGKYGPELPQQE